MSSKRNERPISIENGDEFSDYFEDGLSKYHVIAVSSKVEQLHQAFERLKLCLDQLLGEKVELFQKEIIAYSEKKFLLSKSSEQILKMCEKRIQKQNFIFIEDAQEQKDQKNWNQNDIDILVWVLNKYTSIYAKKSVHSLDETGWKFIYLFINSCHILEEMHVQVAQPQKVQFDSKWSKEESELLASLNHREMKSEELQHIDVANQIFDFSNLSSALNLQKGEDFSEKRTSSVLEPPPQNKNPLTNIVISIFTHNEPTFPQPQYFSVCPEYTPRFFGVFFSSQLSDELKVWKLSYSRGHN